MSSKEVSTTSNNSNTNKVSEDVWIVPVVGNLSTAEYRKLRRLLHDLGRRNIYMRFKYVARLYHSGMLEKMVELLNETGGKRKRAEDEDEDEKLPDAKRKPTEDAETPQSNEEKEEKEDDAALTDYDSDEGDSSDEDEDDEEKEKDGFKFTEGLFRSLYRSRHHVSTQTNGSMNSN